MKKGKIVEILPVETGDNYKKMNILVSVQRPGEKTRVDHILLEAKNSIIGFAQKLEVGEFVTLCYGEEMVESEFPVVSILLSAYYSEKTNRWFNNIIITRIDNIRNS